MFWALRVAIPVIPLIWHMPLGAGKFEIVFFIL